MKMHNQSENKMKNKGENKGKQEKRVKGISYENGKNDQNCRHLPLYIQEVSPS